MRIAIVEDEARAREVIKNILFRIDERISIVSESASAETGEKDIMKTLPDLAFVDIKMPGENGIEMIRRLKRRGCKTQFVIISGYGKFEYAQECIELGILGYILKPVGYDEVAKIIQQFKNNALYTFLPMENQLSLEDSILKKIEDPSGLKNPIAAKTVSYVRKNISQPCRLSEVAAHLKVSPEYLSRIFHDCVSVTFTEFVRLAKIEMAEVLLSKTGMKICEVAQKVGYSNENYFSSVFKEVVGISPKEYRMMHLNV